MSSLRQTVSRRREIRRTRRALDRAMDSSFSPAQRGELAQFAQRRSLEIR
ncbi:hypothetical protein JL107_09220 [Nakamurella flavida]|uniref:Uncharacterized protein n=1 Tax=Nakamurella flavida TaxID=363630 RepID=A0A938YL99_9ACTN|nr:hypothetical protein [Nakamurella flavida]MBM9476621.1 hypothetical protein [Nakamurella flavida]MDP9778941.1 hypothetical protein [Nakamurella flavida]